MRRPHPPNGDSTADLAPERPLRPLRRGLPSGAGCGARQGRERRAERHAFGTFWRTEDVESLGAKRELHYVPKVVRRTERGCAWYRYAKM